MAKEAKAAAEAAAAKSLGALQGFGRVGGEQSADMGAPGAAAAGAGGEAAAVQQPQGFKGSLKGYQLKGLQWLANLYDQARTADCPDTGQTVAPPEAGVLCRLQGLNGILADEMGLGKTVQALSFLSLLAESKGIWGPFVVCSPASTLPNWADEVTKFVPNLVLRPYWGSSADRAILRKDFDPRKLGRRDSPFHILVTSYQLLVQDEKYLRRIKWQYMVLDEAQAIKSAHSIRWRTLLGFPCRNRLLLTGTPIQNSMAELWALLHFIMPTLFDSHEQFAEWFSKGVEGSVDGGQALNEHQLSRLHQATRPGRESADSPKAMPCPPVRPREPPPTR